MRNASDDKIVKYNARFLGTAIFTFGVLKLFEPFHTWFHVQIAKSGLPPLGIPLGIAGEISIGLTLLLASYFGRRLKSLATPIVASASAGLILNMGVAIYVHLQPEVPANVLPLGIKPPFIPLGFLLLAGLNLFQLLRPDEKCSSNDRPLGMVGASRRRGEQQARSAMAGTKPCSVFHARKQFPTRTCRW